MSYSIFVNTCDKFEDCWNPFFKLFSKYWPDYKGKIYLNTEYKDYSYPGIDIVPIKSCVGKTFKGKFATWSQCLKWAMEFIPDDIVLYMQEDYFLKAPVGNNIVTSYVDIMNTDSSISCIQLTDQSVSPGKRSSYENLCLVAPKPKRRVSCQAALWRREELHSIVREYESAWEFECFGTKRSEAINHKYLVVDHNYVKLEEFEIIPYVFTGIIKGQWYRPTEKIFRDNGIDIDLSIRGFWENKDAPLIDRLIAKLKRLPKWIKCYAELTKLK